jgi:hypothetical protein
MFAIRLDFYNVHLGTSFFGPYNSEEEARAELPKEKGWIQDEAIFRNKWMSFDVKASIIELKKLSDWERFKYFKARHAEDKLIVF